MMGGFGVVFALSLIAISMVSWALSILGGGGGTYYSLLKMLLLYFFSHNFKLKQTHTMGKK